MTIRFRTVLAWLVVGHAVVGGLYWLLLQVPESNAWMLLASALVVLAAVFLFGVIESVAALGLTSDTPMKTAVRLGLRRAWLVIFPVAVAGCIWLVTGSASEWLTGNAGRIDAWLIAKTGWTRTSGLHSALDWVVTFVRYGVGASLGAALLAALVSRGLPGLGSDWWRKGLSWKRLVAVSLALLAGFWLPWQAVYWRPASLPSTWIEPAFAAVKLGVLYAVANVAWALVLRRAAR